MENDAVKKTDNKNKRYWHQACYEKWQSYEDVPWPVCTGTCQRTMAEHDEWVKSQNLKW